MAIPAESDKKFKGEMDQSNPAANCDGCIWKVLASGGKGIQLKGCKSEKEYRNDRTPNDDCPSKEIGN